MFFKVIRNWWAENKVNIKDDFKSGLKEFAVLFYFTLMLITLFGIIPGFFFWCVNGTPYIFFAFLTVFFLLQVPLLIRWYQVEKERYEMKVSKNLEEEKRDD